MIPDGESLRGLVMFKLPYGDADPAGWMLTSTLFPGLRQELSTDRYRENRLLVRRSLISLDGNSSHIDQLDEAVARLKRTTGCPSIQTPWPLQAGSKPWKGLRHPTKSVPVPEATDPALVQFSTIKDMASLKKRLARVHYLPTDGTNWHHMFAPQAVLTQNWGSEGDWRVWLKLFSHARESKQSASLQR